MTPVLVHPVKITWELEDGYLLIVEDKAADERPIIVSDHQLKELERRGLLRRE